MPFSLRNLHEYKKVGVILPRMSLFQQPAHPGLVGPHDNEQILAEETHTCVGGDDLYVGEVLAVGADFILAFHDEHAAVTQHAMGFLPAFLV